ncbi:hypothetical protein [Micromonospora globispora]|uniref:hypothetical protein n=1 Tax=Micromonospora globispora TaxID=1450148 RepID=UPI002892C8F3|nr:hypothetical protein [Micromonospora globispora]
MRSLQTWPHDSVGALRLRGPGECSRQSSPRPSRSGASRLLGVIAPAGTVTPDRGSGEGASVDNLGRLMHAELDRLPRGLRWQVAVGRPHPGLYGIARSYEEAREALTMA